MNNRLKSVDLMRAIGIIQMLQSHIWGEYIDPLTVGNLIVRPWIGYGAPLFTIIAGISAYLTVNSLSRGNDSANFVRKVVNVFVRRGIVLFCLSSIVNLIAGPILHILDISIFNWGVIQLIGGCFLAVPIYVWLPRWSRIIFVMVFLAFAKFIGVSEGMFSSLFTGFAPPFPWAFLFFSGMMVGELLVATTEQKQTRFRYTRLLLIGLTILGLGIIFNWYHTAFTWDHMANPTISSLLIFIAIAILMLVVCSFLFDFRPLTSPIIRSLIGLGQHSLTIYYIQLCGIVLSASAFEYYLGHPIRLHYRWFLPLLLGAILFLHYGINVVWARSNYFLSMEWIVNRLAHGSGLAKNPTVLKRAESRGE